MNARSPVYPLDTIRDRLPMREVCEREGLQLRRQSANWIGPCWTCASPRGFTIHGESPHRANCYCCGWKGDIFAFWKERRGIATFPQAVAELASLCGVAPSLPGVSFQRKPVKHRPKSLAESGKPEIPELLQLSVTQKQTLANLRGLSQDAPEAAESEGRLWFSRYPRDKETGRETSLSCDSWAVTDPERWVVQWRRLKPFPYYSDDGPKSLSTRNTAWPLGAAQIGAREAVALVEGGADMLAAYHFLASLNLLDAVAIVCILGTGNNICPEARLHFAGKRVRIFADNDEPREKILASGPVIYRPGWDAAARWQSQLEAAGAASVDVVDFSSIDLPDVKDLNDFARADTSEIDVEALFLF